MFVLVPLLIPAPLLAQPHHGLLQMRPHEVSASSLDGSLSALPAEALSRIPPSAQLSQSPFEINLPVDLTITAAAITIGLMPQMVHSDALDTAQLDPSAINGMDRGVSSNWSPAADGASTALMATSIVLPIAASLVDTWVSDPRDGYSGFFKDMLVLGETLAITSAITGVVKVAVNRPRPYMYNTTLGPEIRSNSDGRNSFFSGHTATAFAMATSYSYLFTLRHPDSTLVVPVWLGTEALAAATAYLRVEAGKHFWSDVLVGAAIGGAIGLAVPYLHKKDNFFSRLLFGRTDKPNVHMSIAGTGLGVGGTF